MSINKDKEIKIPKITENNYMSIQLGYNAIIIVPFEAGLKIIAGLQNAEYLDKEYSKKPGILPFNLSQDFNFKVLSREEYKKYKMNTLLGVVGDNI